MKELCNKDCNNCPIVNHPNSRMVTWILNIMLSKLGDTAHNIVQNQCPNLIVCYDCRIDDFCHIDGECDIPDKAYEESTHYEDDKE